MSETGGYDSLPFIAELYDHTLHYATRADVGFYVELASTTAGSILELGCGTGRVLVAVAETGHSIVGIDLSEFMLEKCRDKLATLPLDVRAHARVVQANMASFDLGEKFSLVTFPFRPFHHLLRTADQLSCLHCTNRHLERGGRLVLDLFHLNAREMFDPAQMEETEDFRDVELSDGRKFRRTQRIAGFNVIEQYHDIELIHYVTHPDGRTERLVQAFPWRYFFRFEVEHLLERCGFKVIEVFGNYDRTPLADDSPEMIFIAEKHRETGEPPKASLDSSAERDCP